MTRNDEVEAWYIANATKIKKWANKRSKQDAEDILQDMAIKLITSPSDIKTIGNRYGMNWIMAEYYSPARGFKGTDEAKLVSLEAAATEASPGNMETDLYNKKCVELVTELVNSVGGSGKQIFQMHFFQDMNYDEIAIKLDMDHKSVKQLGYRAKNIIKEQFNEIIGE